MGASDVCRPWIVMCYMGVGACDVCRPWVVINVLWECVGACDVCVDHGL